MPCLVFAIELQSPVTAGNIAHLSNLIIRDLNGMPCLVFAIELQNPVTAGNIAHLLNLTIRVYA